MEQYFTSTVAASLLVNLVLQHAQTDINIVCEPCAGGGSLVSALKKERPTAQVLAYDIDNLLCNEHGWTRANFLTVEPVSCDIVLCNPPFRSGRSDGDTNGKRGKDLAMSFLIQASKWAPLLGFIMHQNKANPTFDHQLWEKRPDIHLIHRECIAKEHSVFDTANGPKFVPCSIYIYRVGMQRIEPVVYKSVISDDLELLRLNDDRCNLIVKSWGSPNRVGKLVTIDRNDILEITQQKDSSKHGVNMHFYATNLKQTMEVLNHMNPAVREFISYARDCPNVKITPAQFIHLYNKHK